MSVRTGFRDIVTLLTEKFKYNSLFRYRVSSDTGSKVEANIVSKLDGHPDILDVNKIHGVPGIYSTLQQGNQVLLSYENGDPSRPYIVGYYAGVPLKLEVRVVDEVEMKKQSNIAPTDQVVLATNLITTLKSIQNTLISIEAWIVAAAAIFPLTTTETLAGAVTTALGLTGTAISTADSNYPIGIKSTAVKAN